MWRKMRLIYKNFLMLIYLSIILVHLLSNINLGYSTEIGLKGCGIGKTIENAQNKALDKIIANFLKNANLKQIILEEYQGDITQYYYFKNLLPEIKERGRELFSDLEPEIVNEKLNKVCIYLEKNKIEDILKELQNEIDNKIDNIENLSQEEIKKLLIDVYYIIGISRYLDEKKEEVWKDYGLEKLDELFSYVNYGVLYVNVKNVPDAIIIVEGKKYKPGTPIVLEGDKEYKIIVKAEGYKEKELNVYVENGKEIKKRVRLVKEGLLMGEGISLYLYVNPATFKEIVEETAIENGYLISAEPVAKNALYVKVISNLRKKEEDYDEYEVKVVYRFYKGKNICGIHRKVKLIKVYSNEENLNIEKINKLVREGLEEFLGSKLDINRCIGGKEVDYSKLFKKREKKKAEKKETLFKKQVVLKKRPIKKQTKPVKIKQIEGKNAVEIAFLIGKEDSPFIEYIKKQIENESLNITVNEKSSIAFKGELNFYIEKILGLFYFGGIFSHEYAINYNSSLYNSTTLKTNTLNMGIGIGLRIESKTFYIIPRLDLGIEIYKISITKESSLEENSYYWSQSYELNESENYNGYSLYIEYKLIGGLRFNSFELFLSYSKKSFFDGIYLTNIEKEKEDHIYPLDISTFYFGVGIISP